METPVNENLIDESDRARLVLGGVYLFKTEAAERLNMKGRALRSFHIQLNSSHFVPQTTHVILNSFTSKEAYLYVFSFFSF